MTGNEFRSVRKSLGMTQVALASALGMTDRRIRTFENRVGTVPRVVELAVAQLLSEHRRKSDGAENG